MRRLRSTDLKLYGRILGQARPAWPLLVLILIVDLLASPLFLLTPLPLKIAVDNVIGAAPLPWFIDLFLPDWTAATPLRLLGTVAVLQIVIVLLGQAQELATYFLKTYTGEALTLRLRSALFRHAQRLSLAFHDAKGTADSIYRIQYDAPSIQWVTIHGAIPLVTSIVTLISMILITAQIDRSLALIALAVSPFLFLLSLEYNRRMRADYHEVRGLESNALKVVQEVLTAVRVVKAFGQEAREEGRFSKESGAGMRARLRLTLAEGLFGLVINLVIAAGTAAVLFIGARHVLSGRLTLGELLIVVTYLTQLYGPLRSIIRQAATVQSSLAGAQRAFELIDELPEVTERPDARPLRRAGGRVIFREVSFGYDRDHPILQKISFVIEPGMRVGVVGKTGAGKTTLISLLMRFYDPTDGEIALDGVDLRDYRLADLRSQFAIVLQEPVLFSTRIAENIAYARPDAGREEIIAAAQAAHADDFINRLPEGYDTLVGERGMRLSGGERQRISLARAFLKNAPLLILDEPTSSVDTETEAEIMEAMGRLMQGRTTFLISHRPSTLRHCDLLLVIERGRLVYLHSDPAEYVAAASRFGEPKIPLKEEMP
ncbi:MAG: ABC transporter ATP-binding protein/permease [Candidatus Manganitrophus sp. SA1]|nr:ABC transporter ATP-binding protein/permease [Candidatus Manganitrophus morganii]